MEAQPPHSAAWESGPGRSGSRFLMLSSGEVVFLASVELLCAAVYNMNSWGACTFL